MKALLFLIAFPVLSLAQVAPTTQEEYNYITKGYKETVEKGLDIKTGYAIKDAFDYAFNTNYEFNFKQVLRTSTNEVAGTLVIAKSKLWSNTYYLCIPNDYGRLYEEYFKSIAVWDRAMLYEYFKAYSMYSIRY